MSPNATSNPLSQPVLKSVSNTHLAGLTGTIAVLVGMSKPKSALVLNEAADRLSYTRTLNARAVATILHSLDLFIGDGAKVIPECTHFKGLEVPSREEVELLYKGIANLGLATLNAPALREDGLEIGADSIGLDVPEPSVTDYEPNQGQDDSGGDDSQVDTTEYATLPNLGYKEFFQNLTDHINGKAAPVTTPAPPFDQAPAPVVPQKYVALKQIFELTTGTQLTAENIEKEMHTFRAGLKDAQRAQVGDGSKAGLFKEMIQGHAAAQTDEGIDKTVTTTRAELYAALVATSKN
jgi:hypothetical protein